MRSIVFVLLAFVVVSCHFGEYVTPGKDDTSYPCKDEQGRRRADMVSCRQYDGKADCCWAGTVCAPDDTCEAIQVIAPSMGAKRKTKRVKQ